MALKPGGFIPVVHAATRERPDEIDTIVAAEAVAGALTELGFATDIVAIDLDLNDIEALKRREPILVFNLVDAVRGDGRLAPVIPSLLDAVGLPYTGAHSDAWLSTLSKVATKRTLGTRRIADAAMVDRRHGARSGCELHRQGRYRARLARPRRNLRGEGR